MNSSFVTGMIPSTLKISNVIPIYKKGDRTVKNNYRHVSTLPAIFKMFDRAFCDQFIELLEWNNLIQDC